MECMIVHTLCAAGMALVGAVIAKGWPQNSKARGPWAAKKEREAPVEDAFARDLAAMFDYRGEESEQDDA